jgi:hypothetical protein
MSETFLLQSINVEDHDEYFLNTYYGMQVTTGEATRSFGGMLCLLIKSTTIATYFELIL